MNKGDLIKEVEKVTSTKKEAAAAVDAVFAAITKSLKKGADVTIVGFGTFKVANVQPGRDITPRQARQSRSRPRRSPS